MIQFNLLPDVKVQFIKAKRAKRVLMVVSILASAVSVTLLLLTLSAVAFQKRHVSDLNKDIKSYQSNMDSTEDLAKILTIQNQLNSLPALYAERPVTSRLLGFIQSTTPAQVSFSKVTLKFEDNSMALEGNADTLESVNRYVDTLKFTNYKVVGVEGSLKAFSNVVLGTFTRDEKLASYKINLNFDPSLFDSAKEVTLDVPNTITTRSETQLPSSGVFDAKVTE